MSVAGQTSCQSNIFFNFKRLQEVDRFFWQFLMYYGRVSDGSGDDKGNVNSGTANRLVKSNDLSTDKYNRKKK